MRNAWPLKAIVDGVLKGLIVWKGTQMAHIILINAMNGNLVTKQAAD